MGSWAHIPPFGSIEDKCIYFNTEVIRRYGGKQTLTPNFPCLEKSIAAAYNAELYAGNEDAGGLCFIGALMFFVTKNQCFVDGNKRTGLAICLWLLLRFGLTVSCSEQQAAAFILKIAANEVKTREEAVIWLSEHIAAIEPDEDSPPLSPGRMIRFE